MLPSSTSASAAADAITPVSRPQSYVSFANSDDTSFLEKGHNVVSTTADPEAAHHEDTVDREERPAVFKSTTHEILATVLLTFATVMNTASSAVMGIAVPSMARYFQISGSDVSWTVNSFSLVSGTFILLLAGVADKVGRKRLVVFGYAWFALWCLASSFTTSHIIFDFCRGMQGLASAAVPSAGVGILGSNYKNGKRKNRIMAIFNAGAPFGAFIGELTGGITIQYLNWRSIFWWYAIVYSILTVLVIWFVPGDGVNDNLPLTFKMVVTRVRELDLFGAMLSILAVLGFVLAVSQASSASQGWATPYVIAVLVCSFSLFIVFLWWESRVAKPIMPLRIWKARAFAWVMLVQFFSFIGFTGVLSFYSVLYFQNIMGVSAIRSALYLLPRTLASFITINIIGACLHRVSARIVLIFAQTLMVGASLLWALMPLGTSYFAMALPSLCMSVVSADFTFNIANMHTLTTVSAAEQSSAAGIFFTLSHISGSLGISLATSIVTIIQKRELAKRMLEALPSYLVPADILAIAYRGAFWFAVGTACIALFCAFFARVGKLDHRNNVELEFEDPEVAADHDIACLLAPSEDTCCRVTTSGSSLYNIVDTDAGFYNDDTSPLMVVPTTSYSSIEKSS
ncbi:major facilitator superfamily-domain-containing protein [Limtongia smithiae]|uniref:major facilitator superfamily-domain-containing protein n=1 Tax=Limtongia smithiae TaxID=1125753 RepID=UPI0034CF7E36